MNRLSTSQDINNIKEFPTQSHQVSYIKLRNNVRKLVTLLLSIIGENDDTRFDIYLLDGLAETNNKLSIEIVMDYINIIHDGLLRNKTLIPVNHQRQFMVLQSAIINDCDDPHDKKNVLWFNMRARLFKILAQVCPDGKISL